MQLYKLRSLYSNWSTNYSQSENVIGKANMTSSGNLFDYVILVMIVYRMTSYFRIKSKLGNSNYCKSIHPFFVPSPCLAHSAATHIGLESIGAVGLKVSY